jgi:2-polyprenyl-3-methyl-5-hydroxy-6-metoxy-1,4-benzoquinol methylase
MLHKSTIQNIYAREIREREESKSQSRTWGEQSKAAAPEFSPWAFGCADILPFLDPELIHGKSVLDFGCGAGSDMALLASRFRPSSISGIDLSPEMTEKANALFKENQIKAHAKCLELNELPQGEQWDFILSNAVIHLNPEKLDILKQLTKHLSKDGVLFIADFMVESPLPSLLTREFDKSEGLFLFGNLSPVSHYLESLTQTGYEEIEVLKKFQFDPRDEIIRLLQARMTSAQLKKCKRKLDSNRFYIVILQARLSLPRIKEQAKCPLCNQNCEIEFVPSINRQIHPNLFQLLKNWKLNFTPCTSCGEKVFPEIFQLHDMENRKMAFHISPAIPSTVLESHKQALMQYKRKLPHYEIAVDNNLCNLLQFLG